MPPSQLVFQFSRGLEAAAFFRGCSQIEGTQAKMPPILIPVTSQIHAPPNGWTDGWVYVKSV